MSTARTPPPPRRVPTLTEVIDVQGTPPLSEEEMIPLRDLQPLMAEADVVNTRAAASPAAPRMNEDQLIQRVFAELQWQVDVSLEQRLRDALAPSLARLTEALVQEIRTEMVSTLRDLVAHAVTQELARRRKR